MTLLALPGVYRPRRDTELLIAAALGAARPGERALDLCTGTGAAALALARAGMRATAVDLGWRATTTARLNARRAGVDLDVRRGDLFAPVRGERFALITCNPPYVPLAPGERTRRHERAWNAGHDGRLILDALCAQLSEHLEPGGSACIVQSSYAGIPDTLAALIERGLRTEVVARERGALGPIARARSTHLARLGYPTEHEELVVIRAELARAPSAALGARPGAPGVAAVAGPAA